MDKSNKWRGVEGTIFQYNGSWNDPTIYYNGHTYNYSELEEILWDMYTEDCHSIGREPIDTDNFNDFENWVSLEKDRALHLLQDAEIEQYYWYYEREKGCILSLEGSYKNGLFIGKPTSFDNKEQIKDNESLLVHYGAKLVKPLDKVVTEYESDAMLYDWLLFIDVNDKDKAYWVSEYYNKCSN